MFPYYWMVSEVRCLVKLLKAFKLLSVLVQPSLTALLVATMFSILVMRASWPHSFCLISNSIFLGFLVWFRSHPTFWHFCDSIARFAAEAASLVCAQLDRVMVTLHVCFGSFLFAWIARTGRDLCIPSGLGPTVVFPFPVLCYHCFCTVVCVGDVFGDFVWCRSLTWGFVACRCSALKLLCSVGKEYHKGVPTLQNEIGKTLQRSH